MRGWTSSRALKDSIFPCIQDPPGAQLYTQTGSFTKGGLTLPVYRCTLGSFHNHLNCFIPRIRTVERGLYCCCHTMLPCRCAATKVRSSTASWSSASVFLAVVFQARIVYRCAEDQTRLQGLTRCWTQPKALSN